MQNYKIVDFIRISGIDKWFDTGIKCKLALTIKAKIACRNTAPNMCPILGSAIETDKPNFYKLLVPDVKEGRVMFYFGFESQSVSNSSVSSPLGKELEIEAKNGELTVNGNTTTVTPFATEFALDRNFMIGNNRNSPNNNIDCEYYYLQLFDGEDLVFDGIPCVDMDGNPAFYDKITDRLIYAGGTSGAISHPKPHEMFTYHVPKRTDGTLTCNVFKTYYDMYALQVGTSTAQTESNVIVINELHPYMNSDYVKLRVKFKYDYTSSNDVLIIGFTRDNVGSYGGVKLLQYSSTQANYQYGPTQTDMRFNLAYGKVYNLELGNKYIKDLDSGQVLASGSVQTLTDTQKDTSNLCVGHRVKIYDMVVLDGNNNEIEHIVPITEDGVNYLKCLNSGNKYTCAENVMTVDKVSNWDKVTSIDFGGAKVNFQGNDTVTHPFSGNTAVTSITNVNITNTCDNLFSNSSNLQLFEGSISNEFSRYLFSNCISLKSFKGNCPNVGYAESMFQNCSALTYVNFGKFYNHKSIGSHLGNMFGGCNNLQHVEMIVPSNKSGATQSWFSIPTDAPCQAYKYIDNLGDGTVKITFTDKERFNVKFESDNQSALDNIQVVEDLQNNNTNITV